MSTRRKFLFNCTTLAAATALNPLPGLATMPDFSPRSVAFYGPCFEDFSAQVNTMFHVHSAPGRVVELKLVEAALDRPRPQHGRRPPPDAYNEKFSLIFSGPRAELLPQDVFTLEHPRLGRMDLFLVPIFTRNPQKMDYEVIFNRPHSNSKTG